MITSLQLFNFRNYSEREFQFSPGITVIAGPNGVGKTNILEALNMISITNSWRAEKDNEVIKWGSGFTRVIGGDLELVIQTHPYMKRIRIDGVSKRTYQVIGHFPTILFQPDDIQLLYGAPAFRRSYLDRLISQTSIFYTRAVLEMQKVLKQRNRLLKNIQEGKSSDEELSFWDQQLADQREIIQQERCQFTDFLQAQIPALFAEMVTENGKIKLHYLKSPTTSEVNFLQHLRHNRVKEVAAGVSLYGPHREDLHLKWGEHPVEQSMSRGQARALLVAFKIAELNYLTAHNKTKPVLLLDDIFSELDAERRRRLFQVLGDYQIIITTTELGPVKAVFKDKVEVIELSWTFSLFARNNR